MVFAPNGRSLICESCGHTKESGRTFEPPPIAELMFLRRQATLQIGDQDSRVLKANIRDAMTRGKACIADEDHEGAIYYLQKLLTMPISDHDLADTWYWLGKAYENPTAKRKCMENAFSAQPTHAEARRELAILDGRLSPDDIINPDFLPEQDTETVVATSAEIFVCPQCDGVMNYTADQEHLHCPYCGHKEDLDAEGNRVKAEFGFGEFEQDFVSTMATLKAHQPPAQMRTCQCQRCAIEFVLAPETISITCPYCGSVYVTETAETRHIIPPHALVPFEVTEDQAKIAMRDWVRKEKLQGLKVTPFRGVYLPMWTFDMGGTLKWRGKVKRGDDWVTLTGEEGAFYDDVLVSAGNKLPKKLSEQGLDSFDLGQLVGYDARYLADWPAERYQIPLADAAIHARKKVVLDIRKTPGKLVPYEPHIQSFTVNSSNLFVESFKLVLLPVWLVHYKWQEQERIYDVLINGQTGELIAETPRGGMFRKMKAWLRGD